MLRKAARSEGGDDIAERELYLLDEIKDNLEAKPSRRYMLAARLMVASLTGHLKGCLAAERKYAMGSFGSISIISEAWHWHWPWPTDWIPSAFLSDNYH